MRFLEVVPEGRKQPVFVNVDQITAIGPVAGDSEDLHCRIHLADGQVVQVTRSASDLLSQLRSAH